MRKYNIIPSHPLGFFVRNLCAKHTESQEGDFVPGIKNSPKISPKRITSRLRKQTMCAMFFYR